MTAVDRIASERRSQWYYIDSRKNQHLPVGDWDTAIWLAGRGFGKTRTLTEAAWWEAYTYPGIRIHALAPTLGDIHRVVFEGESGFLSVMPQELKKRYNKQDRELELTNGSLITGFSVVEEADRLRGPQCHFLTFDEAAAADRPAGNLEAAYKVASLGVRLPYPDGRPSRKLIATTPRPIPFLKRLCKRPGVVVIQGSSLENRANVSASVMNEILSMEGTLYGRQEIYGEFIDEASDLSIWKRSWFKLWPADKPLPDFQFVLTSYDTAFSEDHYDSKKQTTDSTACIVLGVFNIAQVFDELERKKRGIARLRYGVLLCDAWSERLGFPDLIARAREMHTTRWGKGKRKADIVLIEDKGSGISLRQSLVEYGIPTWPYNPHRESKTMRAHAVAPLIKDGVFFVPESGMADRQGLPRDWAEMFLEQVCAYAGPKSIEHDDWLDTASQALIYLKDRDILTGAPVSPYIDYEDERDAELEKLRRENDIRLSRKRGNPYG